jgi:glycosyltransferase involved in cell wall biosynthesis
MRVTLVAGYAPSLVNFRGPLIEALLARGHIVSAIGPAADPDTLNWLSARGVDYHAVPLSRTSLNPAKDLETLLAVRSALLKTQAQAVVAYTIKAVIYGLLAARLAGVTHRFAMITGLGYAFTDGAASLRRRIVSGVARALYRLTLAQAQVIIFQNPDDLSAFRHIGLVRPHNRVGIVNGSGVDVGHFSYIPLPNEPVCLMIARLVADKGVCEYLAAARSVKAIRPDTQFRLIGPTDPNPAALPPGLLDKAIQDGIVEYLGEQSDVRPAIAASSIYVLPSYREGTPRSVLEAMAMGRPVITTDAPGCRETVEAGVNGLLVPIKAISELVDAMLQLIDEPVTRQRMGDAGRARAVSRYAANDVAQSVIDLLALPEINARNAGTVTSRDKQTVGS